MKADAEVVFLVFAGFLLFNGIPAIITGKMKLRTGRTNRYRDTWTPTHEYVLHDTVVIPIGWIQVIWSIPLLIIGIQSLQTVNPGVMDAIQTVVLRLVKTTNNTIFLVLAGISLLVILIPQAFVWMYGDVRELD